MVARARSRRGLIMNRQQMIEVGESERGNFAVRILEVVERLRGRK